MQFLTKKMVGMFMGAALASSTVAEAADKHYGAVCYGRGASAAIGGYDNRVYAFGIDFYVDENGNVPKFSIAPGTEPTPDLRVIEQMCNNYARESCKATFHNSSLFIQATGLIRGDFSASIINGNYTGITKQQNRNTGKNETALWGTGTCQIGQIKPRP